MTPLDVGVLGLLAVATSCLTAVLGLGGGIILLAFLLAFLPPQVAIPLHGAVQLVSNGSRTWIQRRHVHGGVLRNFCVLLIPAGALGLAVGQALPEDMVRAAIGVFVLAATFAPQALLLGRHPETMHPTRRFLWLGGAIGFLNTTIGATGPLQGPFLQGIGLDRRGVIGTFAACQAAGHLVKIALFGAAGFAFAEYALPCLVLSVGVVLGTEIGSRLLERVSEPLFRTLYRIALTGSAVHLLASAAHVV
jgi:uncharacterized membrane protein YfcA